MEDNWAISHPMGSGFRSAFGPDGLVASIETDALGIQRVRVVRLVATDTMAGTVATRASSWQAQGDQRNGCLP